MQTTLSKTGGVNIGLMNASWPLARLKVSSEKLEITALFLGTYTFLPQDVISIEPYRLIPILGSGVQIHHSRNDCSKRVIFYHTDSPESLIAQIRNTGFECQSTADKVGGGMFDFPVRLWVIILAACLLGLPPVILSLMSASAGPTAKPLTDGQFIYASLMVWLSGALMLLALLKSTTLQGLIMKPDRHFGEIKRIVTLLIVIFGLASAVLAVVACFV